MSPTKELRFAGTVTGSASDWTTMRRACEVPERFRAEERARAAGATLTVKGAA